MNLFSRYVLLLSVLTTLYFLSGCGNDKAVEPAPVVIDTTCIPNGYVVTYTMDIKPILETTCTNPDFGSCHQPTPDGGSGFDYTNYDGISAEADPGGPLENRVLVIMDMPSVATLGPTSLTDCQLAKIQSWINNGAPE